MKRALITLLAVLAIGSISEAQRKRKSSPEPKPFEASLFNSMTYRSVGPSRGGRSTAITGIPDQPFTFFMGTTGGGVWRTDDAGLNWENISDGQISAGSIGAIAVANSDPNVIYMGTGSACPRGNISSGVGMYKSTDQGKNWQFAGLPSAGQIGKIEIHPQDADRVYVAVLGNIFGPSRDRGVYRSVDGGSSWSKVLYINDSTGVVDLVVNPRNPRILYAAAWQAERKPWTMIDGGRNGGIYRSTDSGDTWEKLGGGLPVGLLGRIGLAISPANPDRVWALIQAYEEEDGGLYRSEDGGATWSRINRDHRHRQRGWYYTHITADPNDENTLYSSNTGFYKSVDGGVNFEAIRTPHGDNHGVWINPNDSQIMINCNDGGANVSLNGGKSWSTQNNQPTSEFYRLTVDNRFPYRLFAGQQDNTTISVPSREMRSLTHTEHWEAIGGGESADVAIHPTDPDIVFAGTYSGEITYYNRKTGQRLQMTAYPHYTEGTAQRDLKYRWQWNFPLFVSVHNPEELYMGSQYVHRSTNNGQTWEIISPDLTQSLDKYFDIPGGPVQHDATGVEVYSSIFALEESPDNAGEIWVGTDDGLVHLTRDGGKEWTNITPAGMPGEGTVNKIELSTHQAGRAFVVVYRYRDNDSRPYIFRTNDYGSSWELLTTGSNGIPSDVFVRAIAEDPDQKGLLYAGTEFGMYASFNDGQSWQSMQLNLPVTPITDMEVHQQDLVISTQGRSFWILDDLTPLHWVASGSGNSDQLLPPRPAYRTNIEGMQSRIHFYLQAEPQETVQLEVLDDQGRTVQTWTTESSEAEEGINLEVSQGMNMVEWDLRYDGPDMVDNFVAMVYSADNAPGPKAVPGTFKARLTIGEQSQEQSFAVLPDPRWSDITVEDYQQKFELEMEVLDLINRSQDLVRNIRSIREQSQSIGNKLADAGMGDELKTSAAELDKVLTRIEDTLVQNKIETSQDEINYERVFTNNIARLYRVIVDEDNAPTGGMLERWSDLKARYEELRQPYEELLVNELEAFNKRSQELQGGKIILPGSQSD